MSLFRFSVPVTVKTQDMNAYHVSHDRYFLFFQEARIGYLAMFGYAAEENEKLSLVIADASCSYKKELHLEDAIEVRCRISEIKPKAFVMDYQIYKASDICAIGSTTYLSFDYAAKKVVPFPEKLIESIKAYEGLA